MKNMVKIGTRLAVICAVAAVILGFANAFTAPTIALYKKKVLEQALTSVSEGFDLGQREEADKDKIDFFYPLKQDGETAGYVIQIIAKGYGGPITLLAGFTTEGKIIGVQLLSNLETPGLGKRAEEEGYMDKFIGTGSQEKVPQRKTDLSSEEADAVSGSTITFSGISEALARGSNFAKELGGSQL
ncbi:MAG: RnfABCDGE type electron transport complex subunit G [Spirochaetales bacterium]|jgi:electron transport complex protein RnfG|nr:RnfABCDGE type electron transport complex subunit G [Spirochaetales bacterium]